MRNHSPLQLPLSDEPRCENTILAVTAPPNHPGALLINSLAPPPGWCWFSAHARPTQRASLSIYSRFQFNSTQPTDRCANFLFISALFIFSLSISAAEPFEPPLTTTVATGQRAFSTVMMMMHFEKGIQREPPAKESSLAAHVCALWGVIAGKSMRYAFFVHTKRNMIKK